MEKVSTSLIVESFKNLGVSFEELCVLARGINFRQEEIAEEEAILLRDCYARVKNGEPRVEAFWPWGPGDGETLGDLF